MQINQRYGIIVVLLPITVLMVGGMIWRGLAVWKHDRLPSFSEQEIRQMVKKGMIQQDVERALGKPKNIMEDDEGSGWSYDNNPPSGFPKMIFVIFRDGRVSEIVFNTPKVYRPNRNESGSIEILSPGPHTTGPTDP